MHAPSPDTELRVREDASFSQGNRIGPAVLTIVLPKLAPVFTKTNGHQDPHQFTYQAKQVCGGPVNLALHHSPQHVGTPKPKAFDTTHPLTVR
ncbi:unnamed protein product [Lota lota]